MSCACHGNFSQYKVYERWGLDEGAIGTLYIVGFGSSFLVGTQVALAPLRLPYTQLQFPPRGATLRLTLTITLTHGFPYPGGSIRRQIWPQEVRQPLTAQKVSSVSLIPY